ncbi:unnamed protein product [Euphydryas editha]|uniref:Uncharacterized protein n=1 Tax=Euphydryas editha TaxID=104508 RepID=A0AAU9V7W2_EUPED|nr:unnamed protein product [Euphydryas editha]
MVLNIKFRRGRQSSRAIRARAGRAGAGTRRQHIDSAAPSVGVRRAPRCAESPASGRRPSRGPLPLPRPSFTESLVVAASPANSTDLF